MFCIILISGRSGWHTFKSIPESGKVKFAEQFCADHKIQDKITSLLDTCPVSWGIWRAIWETKIQRKAWKVQILTHLADFLVISLGKRCAFCWMDQQNSTLNNFIFSRVGQTKLAITFWIWIASNVNFLYTLYSTNSLYLVLSVYRFTRAATNDQTIHNS